MTVRLATAADIALLDGMLSRMGQLWSEENIRAATTAPWITVIHETDGKPDGFYCGLVNVALKQTLIGPCDAPHDSYQIWLKTVCEMGLVIEDELVRRLPKEDPTQWWTLTRIWPDTMGPLNNFIETSFNWKLAPNAGPVSGKEGYKILPGGCKESWRKRPNLVATAKAVLAALGTAT